MESGNRLLTAEELAEVFNVKVRSIYAAVRNGTIPCKKLGKLYRFDLEAVMQACNTTPLPQKPGEIAITRDARAS